MKAASIIEDYAVAGAMALALWSEPIATYDLDVLVTLPQSQGSLALFCEPHARTAKRRERVAALLVGADLDQALLDAILDRHGLAI